MIENYTILPNGVIKQIEIVNKIKEYDKKYVDDRYNSYGEKGMQMAYLRLGYLLGGKTEDIKSILDVGYGNGDFLKACSSINTKRYGNDISNYQLPEGSTFVEDILKNEYDVVCFFDSLEHFEDITFVKDLKTKYLYISVPECHNFSDEWFRDWKHRREDEHLWHFNRESLINFMDECGFGWVRTSNVEDIIRNNGKDESNILTGIFKKR